MANYNTPYDTEREGQIEFFDNYGIPYEGEDSALIDNTDGVYNGNILEFKLSISNLNKVLFQAIKYLSRMRIKGESVPATILLVDLNATKMYVYKSKNYFNDIHKVYVGAASKNNEGFIAGPYLKKLDYSNMSDAYEVQKLLRPKNSVEEEFMPIDIDENCIVGWANRFYNTRKNASKGDFLGDNKGTAIKQKGEIRDPKLFKGLINPYKGETNEAFKYLMDCLNDRLSKKDLGAFYTPMPYAKKAAELVQLAVDRVPEGNDYIILDRCAGTGNLEAALIGLKDKNGSPLLSHCIVSTYEYYEYKVLIERFIDYELRAIIPPTEANAKCQVGRVIEADAMSKEYIDNKIIKKYVDNPNCTIILFENPPYSDSSSTTFIVDDNKTKKAKSERGTSFVSNEYKKAQAYLKEKRGSVRELSNLFIWSGFNYYMRSETDSYIIFSPVKYFKTIGLVKKKFIDGFAFNRKYFHATDSVISCVLWANIDEIANEWTLKVVDISDSGKTPDKIVIKEVSNNVAQYNDLRKFDEDVVTNVACKASGIPISDWVYNKGRRAIYNDNIIGYMVVLGFPLKEMTRNIVRCNYKTGLEQSTGYHLRQDNYLLKLPVWCSKYCPTDNWWEKDTFVTCSDGGDAYTKDKDFLKSCLLYTCLSNQNKCLSFDGSDGRRYQNELCFDDSREKQPIALTDLMKYGNFDDDEKALLNIWRRIIEEARQTANYNPDYNYGVYQITKELNTFFEDEKGKKTPDYKELNGDLDTLRTMLKTYYKSHITEKMFKYELLK